MHCVHLEVFVFLIFSFPTLLISQNCNLSKPIYGYDHLYGDLPEIANPTDCAQLCCDNLECVTWTYIPANQTYSGDTCKNDSCCFLKNKLNPINPNSIALMQTGIVARKSPLQCRVSPMQIGYDHAGEDYDSVVVLTPKDCESACCGNANCVAWTFLDNIIVATYNCEANGPCCFLKSRAKSTNYKNATNNLTTTGTKFNSNGSCAVQSIDASMDSAGGDYLVVQISDENYMYCAELCCNDPLCNAWTYSPNAVTGYHADQFNSACNSSCCFLKNFQYPLYSSNNGVITGKISQHKITSNGTQKCVLVPYLTGYDHPGSTINTSVLPNFSNCEDACCNNPDCVSWTYIPDNSSCLLRAHSYDIVYIGDSRITSNIIHLITQNILCPTCIDCVTSVQGFTCTDGVWTINQPTVTNVTLFDSTLNINFEVHIKESLSVTSNGVITVSETGTIFADSLQLQGTLIIGGGSNRSYVISTSTCPNITLGTLVFNGTVNISQRYSILTTSDPACVIGKFKNISFDESCLQAHQQTIQGTLEVFFTNENCSTIPQSLLQIIVPVAVVVALIIIGLFVGMACRSKKDQSFFNNFWN